MAQLHSSAESLASGLELAYRELIAYEMLAGVSLSQPQSEVIECVRAAMQVVRRVVQRRGGSVECSSRGRPRLSLSRQQLESLIEAKFSVPQITHMLGVSISTLRRKMDMFNLAIRATYADIGNDDLAGLSVKFLVSSLCVGVSRWLATYYLVNFMCNKSDSAKHYAE